MSGVTDVAFRALAKKYGAGLTYTEFTNGTGIVRGNFGALQRTRTDPTEKPVAIQLFGNSGNDVIEAARIAQEHFDIIDVNCGCPAWKVIKTGAGSEMLKQPEKIASFINKLATAVTKPVTVKIRTGINDTTINAVTVAKLVENAGAAAIAIHGRTQQQGYSGTANWNIIQCVKEAVNIPVIGNGDVFSPEQFKQKLEYSGVDYIMIARGAIGNPFIFKQINEYLEKGTYDPENRIHQFLEYLELARKYNIPFESIKTHAMNFTKTIRNATDIRARLMTCKTAETVSQIMNSVTTS